MGYFRRVHYGRDIRRNAGIRRTKRVILMAKLTFNRAGWIVCCVEENNWFNYTRFDTIKAARAYLKATPDAWFCG